MEKEKEYLKQKKTRITITKTETIPTQMSNDKVVEVKVDSKDNNDIVKNTKTTKQQKDQNRKTKKKNTAKYNTGRPVLKKSDSVFYDTGLQGKKKRVLKRDNANKLLLGLSTISLVLIMVVVGQFFIMESTDPSNVIHNGTMINGVNVGGLESIEAEQLIYDVFKEKSEDFSLKINYNDKSWEFDKDDFKVNSEIHTIIEEAQKRNALLDDYDESKQTIDSMTKEGNSINVAFNYIFVGLDEKIEDIIKEIEIEPVDSQIIFNANNKKCFEITKDKNGLRVNKEQLYHDINEQFVKSNKIEVNIVTIEELPQVTEQDNINKTQLISTYTTYVSDSTGNRKSNVKKALQYFNGFVVEPNMEVSFNKVTGPHTESNGYKVATVIYNGQFVDGVGGGICQASTTLYNALLLADVEILEVHKHTLPVKYVPLAMDAMVSEYVADLKFVNTLDTPLYITTNCNSESVTVNIYGAQIDYEVKTRSETVAKLKNLGDKVVQDTKKEYTDKVLFKGEKFRLTYPRDGYEAKAYVSYYKDGKLVEEKEIRHEYYSPQQGIIVEGVEEVPAGFEAIESSTAVDINTNNIHNYLIPTNMCP
ncbi:MAG: VanW family protein [Eubacteriales bacterium]|nr:VanW family protein [Eubacteriales bacterium]